MTVDVRVLRLFSYWMMCKEGGDAYMSSMLQAYIDNRYTGLRMNDELWTLLICMGKAKKAGDARTSCMLR